MQKECPSDISGVRDKGFVSRRSRRRAQEVNLLACHHVSFPVLYSLDVLGTVETIVCQWHTATKIVHRSHGSVPEVLSQRCSFVPVQPETTGGKVRKATGLLKPPVRLCHEGF